jgi:hypothetical protein
MPRPRAAEPRSEQLMLRLTPSQLQVLEAAAHLAGSTPNRYAYDLLSGHLGQLVKDDLIRAALANRAAWRQRQAQVVALGVKARAVTVVAEAPVRADPSTGGQRS